MEAEDTEVRTEDDSDLMENDESMSDDSCDYSSDDDSVDSGYGNLLINALFPPNIGASQRVDTRTPMERWRDCVATIRTRRTAVLKFVDAQFLEELSAIASFVARADNDEGAEPDGSWKTELFEAIVAAAINPGDSARTGYLTHAIIGAEMLRLLGDDGQRQFFLAIAGHSTLAFLQLKGIHDFQPNDSPPKTDDKATFLSMSALVEALRVFETPALTEIELVGVKFPSMDSVTEWSAVLETRRGFLRQVNLIGIEPPAWTVGPENGGMIKAPDPGWLDPILLALAVPSADSPSIMDELKLIIRQTSTTSNTPDGPAITPQTLATLLQHKRKWWRLSFDGLGLNDEHLHVLTTMFQRDDTCKAGDLLSLERNPGISSSAYQEFFEGCFFWKRRMGLIKVDDKEWEGQFDLVRSMNNLHNRLDYVVSSHHNGTVQQPQIHRSPKCSFASRDKWVEWLAKLGTGLAWEDDKHRINYLWFTLLEKPEFIYSHE